MLRQSSIFLKELDLKLENISCKIGISLHRIAQLEDSQLPMIFQRGIAEFVGSAPLAFACSSVCLFVFCGKIQ